MRIFSFSALLAALLLISPRASAQLIINELMQSNIDCVIDDLNEFPDSWVELYNSGATTINLGDYSLCDSNTPQKAYPLPEKSLAPGDYVIIYCDKEGDGYHTDFRLDSGKGGAVYLFLNGEIADKVENWKKQPAPNIAYGRKTDGADDSGYQAVPTPGAANCNKLYKNILGEPEFSTPGGINLKDFNLTISLPEDAPAGAVIRYTLDGKEPTESSQQFTTPIAIDKSTVVRAKLFCDGYLSPRATTHSYIRHHQDQIIPIVSIVTNPDYFYDDQLGIYVEGKYNPDKFNYKYDWRRPVNIEYFPVDAESSAINQLCETRVKGGTTRVYRLKSLAVYANKRFGTKRFNYEFFDDQTPGIDEFKSFELRNSGNDFDHLYMRDGIIQQSMGMNCDLDWQPSRPAVVYLNGNYMGILNLRPRSNEDNIYSYYDGLEDIDMIENDHELKEGTWDNYVAFRRFYSEEGHSFEEYSDLMDAEEYCNLMIMNIFYNNQDFPGNNCVVWRPQAEGGKWRWIAKDTDHGLGLFIRQADYPTLNWITTPGYDNGLANTEQATRLLRHLLAVPEFENMFIDRSAVYMGDFLSAEAVKNLVSARDEEWHSEFIYHRSKVNPWGYDYNTEIDRAKTWVEDRVPYFYGHLAEFFGLEAPAALTVDQGTERIGAFSINGVQVRANAFNGKYFPGRTLRVAFTPEANDKEVAGWKVCTINGSNRSEQHYDTPELEIAMPQADKVEIRPVFGDSAVDEIFADIDDSLPCDYYDLAGRFAGSYIPNSQPALSAGVYLIRQGSTCKKVIIR